MNACTKSIPRWIRESNRLLADEFGELRFHKGSNVRHHDRSGWFGPLKESVSLGMMNKHFSDTNLAELSRAVCWACQPLI